MANPEKDKSSKSSVLERAKTRFELASEASTDARKLAIEDQKFRAGDQWETDVKASRAADGRPCLTINRLPATLRQVTNDIRQNRPSIKVNPVDSEADVDTADVLQGLIRHIEYASNAEIAYDRATDAQCTGGFGYFRIVTEYVNPLSFDQEIKIKSILDPMSVTFDPSSTEPDGSDAHYCFITDLLTKDDFKRQFPDAELSRMEDWESYGSTAQGWVEKDGCRIAEYYEKTYEDVEIFLLSDGSTATAEMVEQGLPDGVEVKSERTAQVPKITWYKTNGIEILDETEVPGLYIPVVPVYGDEVVVEGKRVLEGVIRHAKDSQRMYNFMATAEAEAIALAPRAPFVGAEGQFEGHEAKWKTANVKSHAFLEYKPTTSGGVAVPPPQRNVYEAATQAITNARMQSAEDLKATTGIYDASLGNRSNEVSGTAIQRRNAQAQVSNFHLADNLTKSLKHGGRIMLGQIPFVYDTARAVRIIGEDGTQKVVAINQIFDKNGAQTIYDLNKGTYDVTVSTGPSYQTKRQEAVASMIGLVQSFPPIMQSAGDLLVKNMDWPDAQEIAERLKPPNAQDPNNPNQIPPQAQAQMAQMRQMIQALTQQLNHSNQIITQKRLEIDSRERIANLQAENALQRDMLKVDAGHAKEMFKADQAQIDRRLDLLGQNSLPGIEVGAGGDTALNQPTQQPPTGGPTPEYMGS